MSSDISPFALQRCTIMKFMHLGCRAPEHQLTPRIIIYLSSSGSSGGVWSCCQLGVASTSCYLEHKSMSQSDAPQEVRRAQILLRCQHNLQSFQNSICILCLSMSSSHNRGLLYHHTVRPAVIPACSRFRYHTLCTEHRYSAEMSVVGWLLIIEFRIQMWITYTWRDTILLLVGAISIFHLIVLRVLLSQTFYLFAS